MIFSLKFFYNSNYSLTKPPHGVNDQTTLMFLTNHCRIHDKATLMFLNKPLWCSWPNHKLWCSWPNHYYVPDQTTMVFLTKPLWCSWLNHYDVPDQTTMIFVTTQLWCSWPNHYGVIEKPLWCSWSNHYDVPDQTIIIIIILKKVCSARLRESDMHPISRNQSRSFKKGHWEGNKGRAVLRGSAARKCISEQMCG